MSKSAKSLDGLVAVKGQGAPVHDMPTRSLALAETAAIETPAASKVPTKAAVSEPGVPLNFKVPQAFQREFKTYAASHGLKLNQLLMKSFEDYRKHQND